MRPSLPNCAAAVLSCIFASACADPPPASLPPMAAADALPAALHGAACKHQRDVESLVQPVLEGEWLSGLWIGLVSERGREAYAWGTVDERGTAPDEHTVWEIGSITKTFDALLLAKHVVDGRLTLDDPVQALLPEDRVKVPSRNGKSITLSSLVTHTSGLPPLPDNFQDAPAFDPSDPYATYSEQLLYDFLNGYELQREPGSAWQYSNLGGGLLGHALAVELQQPWSSALAADVLEPLGLHDTSVALDASQRARFAQPHDADRRSVTAWNFDVLAAAGALRASGLDVLKYAAQQAGIVRSPQLAEAIDLTHVARSETTLATPSGNAQIGLAWILEEDRFVWHNGGTGGFSSFVGADPVSGTGVVVLANTSSIPWGVATQLGRALQRVVAGQPAGPVSLPPAPIELPATVLDAYTGDFTFELDGAPQRLTVSRRGTQLHASALDAQAQLYAANETLFYARTVQATLTFAPGATRELDTWRLVAEGRDVIAVRD